MTSADPLFAYALAQLPYQAALTTEVVAVLVTAPVPGAHERIATALEVGDAPPRHR
jgi:hypothetical protein